MSLLQVMVIVALSRKIMNDNKFVVYSVTIRSVTQEIITNRYPESQINKSNGSS
jgi:hypothetical protein